VVYNKGNRMKNRGLLLGLSLLIIVPLFLSFSFSSSEEIYSPLPRKIVVFQKWFAKEISQNAVLKSSGGVKIKPLKLVNGIAAYLAPQAEKALLMRGEVLRIDDDIILEAVQKKSNNKGKPEPTQPPQEIPWGIRRIQAQIAWDSGVGSFDSCKKSI